MSNGLERQEQAASAGLKVGRDPFSEIFQKDGRVQRAVEGLVARVLLHLEKGTRSVLVTSAWPGEGKSSLTLQLGSLLAQVGVKTVVVDGDLRRPTVSGIFGLHNELGLAGFLRGQHQPTPLELAPEFFFLPVGPDRAKAVESLTADQVKALLTHLKERFRLVLIDSSPMSAGPDSLVFAQAVDEVVVVVSKRNFRGAPEGHFVEDLRDQGAGLLGCVVVGWDDPVRPTFPRSFWTRVLRAFGLKA